MAKTEDVGTMIQMLLSGLNSFRQEFVTFKKEVIQNFSQVSRRFDQMETRLDKKIDGVEERLTKRIDAIGKQLAYLEDDAPTRDEFDNHEKRIGKLEKPMSSTI